MRKSWIAILGGVFICIGAPAWAQSETIAPVDTGWYDSSGYHDPLNANYASGTIGGSVYRGFIVFAVPAGQPVTGAQLDIFTHAVIAGPNDLALFDVTTDTATLLAGGGGVATHNDLGDGDSYGGFSAVPASTTISITLTADAVAAINAAQGSQFAIGMVNTTISQPDDLVFGGSDAPSPTNALILTRAAPPPAVVPTLTEWAMILLGGLLALTAATIVSRRRLS